MGTLPPEFFLLVVAIISAIFGGLLIWLVGYISGDKPSRQPPTAAASAEPEIAPTNEQELLRVSRTKKGVVVFVQGQRCRHLREVANSQIGRETIEALKAVLAFAEGWLPTPQQSPPSPALEKPAADPEGFLDQLRQRAKFSPENASESSQPGSLLMVKEIDDLVQQRLRERPELAKQRVRLISGKDGNLYIYVGQQTFSSVDDISDPQVQTLIQDAIREWESS
jgi:hypothetical protein